jgi:hypothetical protein
MDSKYLDNLRKKRMQTLIGVWKALDEASLVPDSYRLSSLLINEVVEHYISDVRVIKFRYRIEDRIKLHKVAGLMTASIVRFKPAIACQEEKIDVYDPFINESFAIIHGLAICGECEQNDEYLALTKEPWFDQWLNDFRYLLRYRNYTAESLIFIFQTLCELRFPEYSEPIKGD